MSAVSPRKQITTVWCIKILSPAGPCFLNFKNHFQKYKAFLMDFNGPFLLLHKITQKEDVFLKTICYPGPPSQACPLELFPNYPQSTSVSATGMTTSF